MSWCTPFTPVYNFSISICEGIDISLKLNQATYTLVLMKVLSQLCQLFSLIHLFELINWPIRTL